MSSSEELKRQKQRESQARYRAENREIYREASARYRAKNLDKCREASARYRAKHPDRLKQYRASPKGHRIHCISQWKKRGVECDDEWSEVYDWYTDTTHCNLCDTIFKDSYDKCLDHDHILEGYNVRGVICRSCNTKDQVRV